MKFHHVIDFCMMYAASYTENSAVLQAVAVQSVCKTLPFWLFFLYLL